MSSPHVYDAHFNLVTSFLIDELSKLFPTSQTIIDILRPFLSVQQVGVIRGEVTFPKNYRRLLGAGIFVTDDFSSCCNPDGDADTSPDMAADTDRCGHPVIAPDGDGCLLPEDPLADTYEQTREKQQRGKCRSASVRVVDIDEWDHLTTHSYKFPTLKKPIGCIFEDAGMKICPYDVPNVELRYIRQPVTYKYGYVMNPDDTYSWDPTTTTESQWTENAFKYLVSGITTLFSMYVRDGELRDGMTQLKQLGMF